MFNRRISLCIHNLNLAMKLMLNYINADTCVNEDVANSDVRDRK